MANNFNRPKLRGESEARPVSRVDVEEGRKANLTGASALPIGAIIEFPFDKNEPVELFKQPQENDPERMTYYLGCKINGKDRTIVAGTFTRTDYNGDGSVISPKIEDWVKQFDNPYDLAFNLIGHKLVVKDHKKCISNFGGTNRTVNYPVLEFVN